MIVSFSASSFKSIGPTATVSMYPSASKLKTNQISKTTGLLKCSTIFGTNSSGKSNFINALKTLRGIVLGEYNERLYNCSVTQDDVNKETAFTIQFYYDDKTKEQYRYTVRTQMSFINYEELVRIIPKKTDCEESNEVFEEEAIFTYRRTSDVNKLNNPAIDQINKIKERITKKALSIQEINSKIENTKKSIKYLGQYIKYNNVLPTCAHYTEISNICETILSVQDRLIQIESMVKSRFVDGRWGTRIIEKSACPEGIFDYLDLSKTNQYFPEYLEVPEIVSQLKERHQKTINELQKIVDKIEPHDISYRGAIELITSCKKRYYSLLDVWKLKRKLYIANNRAAIYKSQLKKMQLDQEQPDDEKVYSNWNGPVLSSSLKDARRNPDIKIKRPLEFEHIARNVRSWFRNTLVILDYESFYIPPEKDITTRITKIIQSFDVNISEIAWREVSDSIKDSIITRLWACHEDVINTGIDASLKGIHGHVILGDFFGIFLLSFHYGEITIEELSARHSDSNEWYSLSQESDGTRRLIEMSSILMKTNRNKVFVVDELNSRLHPLLTRNFIERYLKGGKEFDTRQLIFTTHESYIMTSSLFRNDQIWLMDRDPFGYSTITRLPDWKKQTDFLDQMYLDGCFGGVPILDDSISPRRGELWKAMYRGQERPVLVINQTPGGRFECITCSNEKCLKQPFTVEMRGSADTETWYTNSKPCVISERSFLKKVGWVSADIFRKITSNPSS